MSVRTVAGLHPAARDDIGDLVTRRPLPGPGLAQVDPFLFLNHHGPQTYPPANGGLPFGPHPHRGFETVTFVLEGSLAHFDSGGHQSIIDAGGVQWMTAGSGLIHAEVSPPAFKRDGGPLEILQLWVNLPRRLKMVEPGYTGLQQADIPAVPLAGGGRLALIAGAYEGRDAPIRSLTGLFLSVVTLPAGAAVTLPAPAGRSVFLYVVRGRTRLSGVAVEPWQLVRFADDGDRIAAAADTDAVLLFGHGAPIDEPVVAHGPFVMTTQAEIAQAIRDYQAGLFDRGGPLPAVGA
jgi:redox-sensitive bicupin YhaK (pirin superfamily)